MSPFPLRWGKVRMGVKLYIDILAPTPVIPVHAGIQ